MKINKNLTSHLTSYFNLSSRTIYLGLLTPLILGYLLISFGCVPINKGTLGTLEKDGFILQQLEFENVLFEASGLSIPITPSRNYWIKKGEAIAPKWDTFELHWEKKEKMCNFTSNQSTNDCHICNYCSLSPENGGSSCEGVFIYPEIIKLVFDENFTKTENPETILDYFSNGDIQSSCQSNPLSATPTTFEPEKSGTYRFASRDGVNLRSEINSEMGIHVVESGQTNSQTTAYQLTYRNVDNRDYWTWATEGNAIWTENFSPNLRVRDVRIYRGLCADGSMQGKQCAVPTERVPVKPSRLLFLPNFQGTVSGYQGEAAHRCYGDANANTDNSISLLNCRQTNGATQTLRKDVTPTYEVVPSRPNEKMTWFIEFNTNEGGDADLATPGNQPMPNDANLIVEFTIEVN